MEKMGEFGLKESGKRKGAHHYFVKALTLEDAWKKLASRLNKTVGEVWKKHYLCYKNLPREKVIRIPHKERTFVK